MKESIKQKAREGKVFLLAFMMWGVTSCATTDMGTGTGGTGTETGGGTASQAEQSFITSAGSSQQFRLRLGEMAGQKTANLEVREFARLAVSQQTRASSELKGVAQQMRVNYPASVSPGQQETIDRLSNLTGGDFDKSFAREMELSYQQDISLHQSAGPTISHLALRAYIIKTTPVLQGQLRLATQLKNILP